jgi:hypothetical protein
MMKWEGRGAWHDAAAHHTLERQCAGCLLRLVVGISVPPNICLRCLISSFDEASEPWMHELHQHT